MPIFIEAAFGAKINSEAIYQSVAGFVTSNAGYQIVSTTLGLVEAGLITSIAFQSDPNVTERWFGSQKTPINESFVENLVNDTGKMKNRLKGNISVDREAKFYYNKDRDRVLTELKKQYGQNPTITDQSIKVASELRMTASEVKPNWNKRSEYNENENYGKTYINSIEAARIWDVHGQNMLDYVNKNVLNSLPDTLKEQMQRVSLEGAKFQSIAGMPAINVFASFVPMEELEKWELEHQYKNIDEAFLDEKTSEVLQLAGLSGHAIKTTFGLFIHDGETEQNKDGKEVRKLKEGEFSAKGLIYNGNSKVFAHEIAHVLVDGGALSEIEKATITNEVNTLMEHKFLEDTMNCKKDIANLMQNAEIKQLMEDAEIDIVDYRNVSTKNPLPKLKNNVAKLWYILTNPMFTNVLIESINKKNASNPNIPELTSANFNYQFLNKYPNFTKYIYSPEKREFLNLYDKIVSQAAMYPESTRNEEVFVRSFECKNELNAMFKPEQLKEFNEKFDKCMKSIKETLKKTCAALGRIPRGTSAVRDSEHGGCCSAAMIQNSQAQEMLDLHGVDNTNEHCPHYDVNKLREDTPKVVKNPERDPVIVNTNVGYGRSFTGQEVEGA
jgi:hypothetical protein